MDVGLDVRFLFSPYATAFAAGALFAFCVSLLKQRYKSKKRRDSAPESLVRNPEPEFQNSPGLTKYNSVGSLNNTTLEDLIPRSLPTISNFPAFDGGRSVPGIGGLPCIAKLRSFTFSDDLINLERRFARFYDGLEETGASKSHSYSLPNFQRSRTWVPGSVYHQFQPFTAKHHSQFLKFCNWKPFQKNRRTVSLEYPKLPVVYDPGSVLTKAAKAILKNDFREMDDYVLRKRKSLPCFLKDINAKQPKKDLKPANVVQRFVDFPPTNAELCKYLESNRDSGISEKYSHNSKVIPESFPLSGINKNNLECSISTWDNNTLENPLIRSEGIESTDIVSNSQTNAYQIQDSSYNKDDIVLESYAKIINCSKKLGEYYEREISTYKRDINFLKFINTEKISSESHTKNILKFESSYFKEVNNEAQITEESFLKFGNLYQDKEINNRNEISTESPIINNSIANISCSSEELNNSEYISIEYSTEEENENSFSTEKIDNSDPMEFPSENSSTLECSSKNDETSKKEPPAALRNCQNTGASGDDTAGRIEAEKSINSGNNSPKENLGKIQKPADKGPKARGEKEFLLSLTLGPEKSVVTNDRDVTRGGRGGSRGVESRTRADESGKRQMDRGTRERSVDGWEISCAPARVFESSVSSSETRNGVTTTVVSSVSSSSSLDPWSEVLDATFSNGTDMSVRTVISTTDHSPLSGGSKRSPGQFRIDIATVEQKEVSVVSPVSNSDFQKHSSLQDKSIESPDTATRTFQIQSMDLKLSPETPIRTLKKPPMDLQEKSVVSPTRSNGSLPPKQPLDQPRSATSPTGKPIVPVKPSHLMRARSEEGDAPLEQPFRPQFEEYMAEVRPDTKKEFGEFAGRPLVLEESSPPRVSRLLGLLSRDEERRAQHKASGAASIEEKEEWDEILRGVLASVSELEKFGGVGEKDAAEGGEDDGEEHRQSESSSSRAMDAEVEILSSPPPASSSSSTKEETPTKVKNLRFKLDPDIFDVPSDDSFYDDDEEENNSRGGWRTRHRAYHTVEVGDEPVRLVSVHASVVPAGQKMVARPVGIDLRVRLTEERAQSKRAHVGTSPLQQAKRRSPVSDSRSGWCQELSPVTENVDWRETFTSVPKENGNVEVKPVPNGILKTPSPKAEVVPKDTSNPFKEDLTNGGGTVHVEKPSKPNGMTPWNPPQKKFSLPRKKFEPDPEAVDRITGYKIALSKPPLPPPVFQKMTTPPSKRNRAEMARKQYLDSKAALSGAQKADGSQKFQQFLAQAQSDRARIVTSVPDLVAIERAVNEKWSKERGSASPRESPAREENGQRLPETPSSRGSTPDDAWSSYVQTCRKHLGRRSQSMTYLETDVDLHLPTVEDEDKWRSTTDLDRPDSTDNHSLPVEDSDFEQSREDLNDSGRAKSEHELRIQRSLQSLPLPDWYKRSDKPKTGFLLKSSEKEKRGWAAAKSLASSTSSLASCGVKRPVHSLRSSRENIPWSRGVSPSPDGPALSLALARAFREPYLGWRARTSTTSSGISSSPNSSWCAATTDEEANGISFDGEDAFLGRTSSEDDGGRRDEPPSPDDTGADAVTVSMDTGDLIKLPGGEDTCDDINNMSMDTCEMFDAGIVADDNSLVPDEPSLVHEDLPSLIVGESSPQDDTGDNIDNLSTDTTTDSKRRDKRLGITDSKRIDLDSKIINKDSKRTDLDSIRLDKNSKSFDLECKRLDKDSKRIDSDSKRLDKDSKRSDTKKDPKSKRYSYSRSIYHSEWDDDEESRGDRKGRDERDPSPTSPDPKVIWIESSFVGSRTTTSIVVLPEGRESKVEGDCIERPASR